MGDDNVLPPSKKRAAGREISRVNPSLDDEEDVSEMETETFKKASDEVLATRRIVKVRRPPTSLAPAAPSSNPFASIRLVPPIPSETKNEVQANLVRKANNEADEKTESNKETDGEHKLKGEESEEKTDDKGVDRSSADQEKVDSGYESAKDTSSQKQQVNGKPTDEKAPETNGEETDKSKRANNQDKTEGDNSVNEDEKQNDSKEKEDDNDTDVGSEATPFSSFHQLSSSKNAFSGLAGTGFSTTSFSFGSVSKDGSPSVSPFRFGTSSEGSTPLFGATTASANKNEGSVFPSLQEVPVETGEENEDTVFAADSALFEFLDGGWKERGKGEVKVNVSNTGTQKSRLVMRARGNYRLIMNTNLYPDMKLTKMDKKGITFACVNSATEGKIGLATFALKFKEASLVESFSAAVTAHKGEAGASAPALKTPENSPKAEEV